MNNFWDERYKKAGKIWGEKSSRTALAALEIFRRNGVKKILVPGSGYGRHTRLFSSSGFDVTGVELSPEACRMARDFDPQTKIHYASVLDMAFLQEKYDAIYCFNVLHLFREDERKSFIRQCAATTGSNGLMYFTVFSENEESYGKGRESEKNTFESKPGRPVHYFTERDLREHFNAVEILTTGIAEDPEDHGDGPHTHLLRYICVRVTVHD